MSTEKSFYLRDNHHKCSTVILSKELKKKNSSYFNQVKSSLNQNTFGSNGGRFNRSKMFVSSPSEYNDKTDLK